MQILSLKQQHQESKNTKGQKMTQHFRHGNENSDPHFILMLNFLNLLQCCPFLSSANESYLVIYLCNR